MPPPRSVLISEPSALAQVPFLPYVSMILKSWWRRHAESLGAFEWLDPIYLKAGAEQLLTPYGAGRIDVLGLSCYTWNWELQRSLARLVKERHPDCLVVAGGPHPDCKQPAFFRDHPEIDIVVAKDGEIPFTRILDRLAAGSRDFSDIPGLDLPGSPRHSERSGEDRPTGSTEVPSRFDHSPYLDETAFYESLVTRHGRGTYSLVWETNRGCPYSCSFCDWGSSTMSRVRAFDMERVRAEAEWIGRIAPHFVFVADANFGILPRDLEIADCLDQVYRSTGYPKALYYSPAKNHPDRTVEIALKFAGSGIVAFHTLAIQHTHPEVLAAVNRSNISTDKQRQIVRRLLELDVPLDVQLIVGLPGDSPDRWKACLAELMEWGVHQEYIVFPYSLLPNAPAADQAALAKWNVRWIDREVAHHQSIRSKDARDSVLMSRIVVSTRTYSPDDWVEMRVYTAFVQALHNCSLTRLVAIYLHFTHGVSYDRFYRLVIDEFCAAPDHWLGELREALAQHYRTVLDDAGATDDLALDEFPSLNACVDASRWLFVKICRRFDPFFEYLGERLLTAFPSASNLPSALHFQKNMIVLPNYRPRLGKRVLAEHDWIGYFRTATRLSSWEQLDEPVTADGGVVTIRDGGNDDDASHFDWGAWPPNDERRWVRWFEQTVLFRRAASRSLFRHLHWQPGTGSR